VSKLPQTRQNSFHEVALCELHNIPEAEKPLWFDCPAYRMCKDGPMFEFVIAAIAFSSASIFLAHAVEAYLT